MKVYIAGKITGDPDYFEKFRRVETELEAKGYVSLNPAMLPAGMIPADYMRICFSMIDCADVVLFLPDWRKSRGTTLEHDYCCYIGKQTMFI